MKLDILRLIPDGDRCGLHEPFNAQAFGKDFVAATDGHVFVAIEGRTDSNLIAPKFQHWFEQQPAFTAGAVTLKAFASDAAWVRDCFACGGMGWEENDDCGDDWNPPEPGECVECRGTGYEDPTRWEAEVVVGPVLVRRCLLARAVSIFDDSDTIEVFYRNSDEPLCFRTVTAFSAVMGLKQKGVELSTLLHFEASK